MTRYLLSDLSHMICFMFQGPREYRLRYRVFDDKFDNETMLVIYVTDVNDNPPKFQYDVYNVTDIVEEEEGISEENPKFLLTVSTGMRDWKH